MSKFSRLNLSRPLFLILVVLLLVVGVGVYYLYRPKVKPLPPEEVTEVGIEYPRGTVERIEEGKIVIKTGAGLRTLLVDENTVVTLQAESLAEALSDVDVASLGDIKVRDEIAASVKTFSDGTARAFFITIFQRE